MEGVVPFCELFVGKVLFKRGLPSPADNHWFVDGLQWACNNADIISISLGISDKLWSSTIETIIDDATSKGKILVCSSGNMTGNTALNTNGDFPAKYRNCISVGALDFDFKLSALTKKSNKIDINLPGEFIISTYKHGYSFYGRNFCFKETKG
jgi:hypothetical protein